MAAADANSGTLAADRSPGNGALQTISGVVPTTLRLSRIVRRTRRDAPPEEQADAADGDRRDERQHAIEQHRGDRLDLPGSEGHQCAGEAELDDSEPSGVIGIVVMMRIRAHAANASVSVS